MTNTTKTELVFLGGSCNPTTWRFDTAIPALEAGGVSFYNPQRDDWSPELEQIEAAKKEECPELVFVIDDQTRAIASIAEAMYYIGQGRSVHVVVKDIPDGTVIEHKSGNQTITGRELDDLNRGREYVRGAAERSDNACVYNSVEELVSGVIAKVNS